MLQRICALCGATVAQHCPGGLIGVCAFQIFNLDCSGKNNRDGLNDFTQIPLWQIRILPTDYSMGPRFVYDKRPDLAGEPGSAQRIAQLRVLYASAQFEL